MPAPYPLTPSGPPPSGPAVPSGFLPARPPELSTSSGAAREVPIGSPGRSPSTPLFHSPSLRRRGSSDAGLRRSSPAPSGVEDSPAQTPAGSPEEPAPGFGVVIQALVALVPDAAGAPQVPLGRASAPFPSSKAPEGPKPFPPLRTASVLTDVPGRAGEAPAGVLLFSCGGVGSLPLPHEEALPAGCRPVAGTPAGSVPLLGRGAPSLR